MGNDAPDLIDGYTYVQALRKGSAPVREFRARPTPTRLPGADARPKSAEEKALQASHIGHTVNPLRFDIICYDCGYAYSMQGRIYKALCPKCRKFLDATDVVVDSNWDTSVRTIGTFTIQGTGVVRNAEIVATDIIIAGDARGAQLRAMRRLEILPGAAFDLTAVKMQDLLVHGGAVFAPPARFACRHAEIAGTLKGRVEAAGTVTIRPGGVLMGELCGAHLVVEDGGGLLAKVAIRRPPEAASQAVLETAA